MLATISILKPTFCRLSLILFNNRKTDPKRMHTVMYLCLEALRIVGLLLQVPHRYTRTVRTCNSNKSTSFILKFQPLIPGKANKLLNGLSVPTQDRFLRHTNLQWEGRSGLVLAPSKDVLFPKRQKD